MCKGADLVAGIDPATGEIRTWLDLVPGGAIQRVLADAGIASRRAGEQLIEAGSYCISIAAFMMPT